MVAVCFFFCSSISASDAAIAAFRSSSSSSPDLPASVTTPLLGGSRDSGTGWSFDCGT